jgi:hypothetical protein
MSLAPGSPPPKPAPSAARIIARRATDLLAISLIAVVGLSAGREIIAWWRTDDATVSAGAGIGDPLVDWSSRSVEIEFGTGSPAVRRIPFRGDDAAAKHRLIQLAREALVGSETAARPVPAEEADWIAALKNFEPEESQPELGTIYAPPGFLPSIAATKSIVAAEGAEQLVAWGMALPTGENTWTLLMFVPTGIAEERRVVLPRGAQPLLSWRDGAGNEVISFYGRGDMADWLADLERQLGTASARQLGPDGVRAAARWKLETGTADVQMSRNGDEITGLLWITRASSEQNNE